MFDFVLAKNGAKFESANKPKGISGRGIIEDVLRGFSAKSWSNWFECKSGRRMFTIEGGGKFEGQTFSVLTGSKDNVSMAGTAPNLKTPVIQVNNGEIQGAFYTAPTATGTNRFED